MPATSVMSGARAKLGFWNSTLNKTIYIGIYTDVSYGWNMDVQPAPILGRYTAAATEIVAVDLVHITCNGWRVVKHGPWADGQFPRLDQLAKAGYLSMAVMDRQTDEVVASITKVRPVSFSGGFNLRTLAQVNMSYVGILLSDETAKENFEDASAMDLPQD